MLSAGKNEYTAHNIRDVGTVYTLLSRTRPAGPGKHPRKPVRRHHYHGATFFPVYRTLASPRYNNICCGGEPHRTWQVGRLYAMRF